MLACVFSLFNGVTRKLNSSLWRSHRSHSQRHKHNFGALMIRADVSISFLWYRAVLMCHHTSRVMWESYHRAAERPEWWSSAPASSEACGEKKTSGIKLLCKRGIGRFSHTRCCVKCQILTSDKCMLEWAWPLPVLEWGNHWCDHSGVSSGFNLLLRVHHGENVWIFSSESVAIARLLRTWWINGSLQWTSLWQQFCCLVEREWYSVSSSLSTNPDV